MNPERDIVKETAAARALRDAISSMAGDDPEVVRDTIEGETGLHEAIISVCRLIREDEIMLLGLSGMLTTLEARKHRIGERIERCRAAIEQAMVIGELKRFVLPDASLTLKSVPPGIEIVNEELIPAEFWKERDPVLDRAALKTALKEGRSVAGATLGNGGICLQVRRS